MILQATPIVCCLRSECFITRLGGILSGTLVEASSEVPLRMSLSLVTETEQEAQRTNYHQHLSPELQIFSIISNPYSFYSDLSSDGGILV